MKILRLGFAISSSLLFTACAHNYPQNDMVAAEIGQPPITQISDEASTQIAEAASSVSQSFTSLEAVEKANMTPQAAKRYPTVGAMQMEGISSVDWNGPIEPLVRQIAKAAGYHVSIVGGAPVVPIIVTVHANEDQNANILRNAALQANHRATLTTNPQAKIITLRYLGS